MINGILLAFYLIQNFPETTLILVYWPWSLMRVSGALHIVTRLFSSLASGSSFADDVYISLSSESLQSIFKSHSSVQKGKEKKKITWNNETLSTARTLSHKKPSIQLLSFCIGNLFILPYNLFSYLYIPAVINNCK